MPHLLIETDFTHYDVNAMLGGLPPSWRTRAERYKPFAARLRSVLGYTLLMRIMREQCGMTALPPIATDEHGKPFLVDCPLHFSISHCNAAVACAVDERPIGLDVQDNLTDISPALAARIAAPLDPDGMSAEGLTRLWTQKEASAKLDGRGLKIGLEHLPLNTHTVETQEYPNFILSVCKNSAEG